MAVFHEKTKHGVCFYIRSWTCSARFDVFILHRGTLSTLLVPIRIVEAWRGGGGGGGGARLENQSGGPDWLQIGNPILADSVQEPTLLLFANFVLLY